MFTFLLLQICSICMFFVTVTQQLYVIAFKKNINIIPITKDYMESLDEETTD